VNSRGKRAALLVALVAATFVVGSAVAALTAVSLTLIGRAVESFGWTSYEQPGPISVRMEAALSTMADGYLAFLRRLIDGSTEGLLLLAAVTLVSAAPAMIAAPALGKWEPGTPARSLRWSIAGAAVIGGACAVGILATLWDVVGLVRMAAGAEFDGYTGGGGLIMTPMFLVPTWLATGGIWAWALARAGRARAPDSLDRFVRWLFAGTCLELAIAAPTYALAMRRESCYCAFGSWWAITAGTTALMILCGPMIILMATRRARMAWMRSVCTECGYPRRGGWATCPECGFSRAPAGAPSRARP